MGAKNIVVEDGAAVAGSVPGAFSVGVPSGPVRTGGGSRSVAPLIAVVAAAVAVLAPRVADAQLMQMYTMQGPMAAPYSSLSGGIAVSAGAQVAIPFDFVFYGEPETTVSISLYGYLTFGGVATKSSNYGLPNTQSGYPTRMIAGWWDSLGSTTTYSPSTVIKYGTIGSAPNRVMIVEWSNVCASSCNSTSPRISFQIQLYEGSNKIRVHYGPGSPAGASASVGLMGSTTVGLALSCTPSCSGSNYQAGQYYEFALPPDLQIKSTSAELVGYAGVSFLASAVVTNKGGVPVAAYPGAKVRFYLSSDATFDPGLDPAVGDTDPGVAVNVNQEVTVAGSVAVPTGTAEGAYFLFAEVDPDHVIGEGINENNNLSPPIPFTVGEPTPDLTVSTVSGPTSATTGATLNVSRTVRNIGNKDTTAASTATWFLSDNSVVTISDLELAKVTIPALAAGANATATDPVTLPSNLPAGRYWIGLCVDYDSAGSQGGVVQEISEVNNCATGNSFVLNTGALTILTTSLTNATQNGPYGLRLEATGGNGSYTWALDSGALPPGMSLSSAGDLGGTPYAAGTSSFAVKVTSGTDTVTQSLSLTVIAHDLPLAIVDQDLPTAEFGRSYLHPLVATGGAPPYAWALRPGYRLPGGLALSPEGYLEGRPSEVTSGTAPFEFSVEITDAAGLKATKSLGIRVVPPSSMHIATSRLQDAVLGKTYRQTLSAIGGSGVYTWSVVKFQRLAQDPTEAPKEPAAALPETLGISLVEAGQGYQLSGTAKEAGLYAITLRVQDKANTTVSDTTTLPLLITYDQALAITTTALPDAFIGQPYNALLSTNAAPETELEFAAACVQQVTSTGNGFTYGCVPVDPLQALPEGLVLGSDGSITGLPAEPQLTAVPGDGTPEPGISVTYSFLVKVTDQSKRSDVRSLSIKVRPYTELNSGCSGAGLGPAAMALFALSGLWIRRRRS